MTVYIRVRDGCHRIATPLHGRWQRLESNDRRALGWMGAFVLVVVAWLGIWQPALNRLKMASVEFEQQRELRAYLEAGAGPRRERSNDPVPAVSAEQLRGVVTASATASGLVIERMEDDGAAGLEIRLADASVTRLLGWITTLEERGIRPLTVELMQIEAGHSDVRMVLGR